MIKKNRIHKVKVTKHDKVRTILCINPNIITQAQTKYSDCIGYPAYGIVMEEMTALSAAADIDDTKPDITTSKMASQEIQGKIYQ